MTLLAPRPRRILLLIHDLGIGGAETLVANLARALVAAGDEPLVCGWRGGGANAERLRAEGIEVLPPVAGAWSRLLAPLRLARLVRDHRIDLVHAHLSDSAFWALTLRVLCGTPALVTHHSTNLTDNMTRPGRLYTRFRAWLLRLSARHLDLNVVVSPAVEARLREAVALPASRIAVIPNGVRVAPVERPDVRDRAQILYAGRLRPEKGIDLLIEAVPAVLEVCPDARFVLLGDGFLRESLARRIGALGLGARVELAGAVPDIAPWLARVGLVVVPSRVEGLPVTVLEAMAQGVPVVATDIPGNRALIGDGAQGWLCAPESPEALAQALTEALAQPERAAERARRAHAMVRDRYSLEVMAERYREAYCRVFAGRGAGRSRRSGCPPRSDGLPGESRPLGPPEAPPSYR